MDLLACHCVSPGDSREACRASPGSGRRGAGHSRSRGRRVRERERTALPCGLVSGFKVMRVVSGLSLASHSELGFFLGAHASLSRDGFQRGGSWEVGTSSGVESPISF